jgi:hypothetical protein
MPAFEGSNIQLELQHVLHRLHIDDADSVRNRPYREALSQGIPLVARKALPCIWFDTHPLSWISEGVLELHGRMLRVGKVVEKKLRGAHACSVGIATIGAGVEETAREMKRKSLLHSLALEGLGAIALDAALEEFFRHLDDAAAESGVHAGVPFSPGETEGWPLEDQRVIYGLLEDELGDVAITDSCLLVPKNSVSFLMGMYDHAVREEGDSHCNYCSMRNTCLYRPDSSNALSHKE